MAKQDPISPAAGPDTQDVFSGKSNTIVSGTSSRFHAPDLRNALSIKAVLAGSVIWETDGQRFVVRENSYLVVNRGQPYTFTIDSVVPSTTQSVFFRDGFVEEVHRTCTLSDAALLDSPNDVATNALNFRQRLEPEPSGVLAALRTLRVTPSEEAFFRVAGILVREFARADEAIFRLPAARASTREELLRRVLKGRDCLLSRMNETVSIADAAAAACMSPYHFLRTFRMAFRATPHQFLTTQRLTRARMLLREGNRSVTEVCFDSGFQSLGSFSSLFRRRFGVSPQEMQRARNVWH